MGLRAASTKEFVKTVFESLVSIQLASLPDSTANLDSIQKILVFAYHGLGNFIMYTPALRLIRERFPKARIDLQVGNNTGNEHVLDGSGLFDNIYNMPYSAGPAAWLRRALEMRQAGYDLTINEFHSQSWQIALLLAASGARLRAGHVTSPGWSRRFSRYSFVFNIPVLMREDEHEVERYLDLAEAVGASALELSAARPFIHLMDSDRTFASDFLTSVKHSAGATVLGIQPGASANMRWKQWPQDRYRRVIELLVERRPEVQVVLFGLPSEADITRELAKGFGPKVVVAAGKTSVKQVAAMIQACDALVCNDSGLMHAAVAVGTPVIAIYGPTDIRRTAPMGERNLVVRHDLPCSPCFKLEGEDMIHQCPHHDCLMTISAEEVFEAVDRSLNAVARPPSGPGLGAELEPSLSGLPQRA
jgi:heptosyltransferase-2